MDTTLDIQEFQRRLTETIAWCSAHANILDPAGSLRSPAMALGYESYEYHYALLSAGQTIASGVAEERRRLLRASDICPNPLPPTQAGGRLLVYQPDASFCEAWAEDATGGFLDEWDTPPWDTWIWYTSKGHISTLPAGKQEVGFTLREGLLVSWIPPVFLHLVQTGIKVLPFGGIQWAEEINVTDLLIEALRMSGIIGRSASLKQK